VSGSNHFDYFYFEILVIGDSCINVPDSFYSNKYSGKTVTFGMNVQTIEDQIFYNCSGFFIFFHFLVL
jgi:hypothetical protein